MVENIDGSCLDLIIHPGETLKEVLDDRNILQKELAIRTGITEKHISNVINGKKKISPKFAKDLEYALGIDASFWNNLQTEYNQEIADFEQKNSISDEEIKTLGNLKEVINYLIKIGIFHNRDNNQSIILKMRKLLGVKNLTYIPKLVMQGAFRGSESYDVDPYVICAWQKICELKLENQSVNHRLDTKLLREHIPQIKRLMFNEPNSMRKELQEIFEDCGIAFDIVQNFKKAPVQGFIKKTDDGKMLLCMTIRQAFADIFWFTLFHEIGHILNGDVKKFFCDYNFKKDETETRADEFAKDTLIDKNAYKSFCDQADYSSQAIRSFAAQEEIPTFIVIGRLQKEGIISYSQFSNLKTRYKWA